MLKGNSNYSYLTSTTNNYLNAISDSTYKVAVNNFINNIDISKTKDCGIFLGNNLTSALVRLNGNTLTANGITLNYSRVNGISGNSVGNISSSFIPTNNGLSRTDITLAVYSLSTSWNGVLMGSLNDYYCGFGSGNNFSYLTGSVPTHPVSTGLLTVTSDVSSYNRYFKQTTVTPGAIEPNVAMILLNHTFNASSFPCNAVIGGYWIGNRLDQIEVGKLSSAFDLLHYEIGRKQALRAVFFGDSITAGQGASSGATKWSTLVANRLGVTEINKGIGGTVLQNTSPTLANNGIDRFYIDVYAQIPWKTYILYGLNDLRYNNVNYTVETYKTALETLIDYLINNGVYREDIVLGSPPYINPSFYTFTDYIPFDGGSVSKHEQFVEVVKTVASTRKVVFKDIYAAMKNRNELITADGIHPNDLGHEVIANTFMK